MSNEEVLAILVVLLAICMWELIAARRDRKDANRARLDLEQHEREFREGWLERGGKPLDSWKEK